MTVTASLSLGGYTAVIDAFFGFGGILSAWHSTTKDVPGTFSHLCWVVFEPTHYARASLS